VHDNAPYDEDVPAGQSRHFDAPPLSEYDPGKQYLQVDPFLKLYCPAGQSGQYDDPPGEDFPGSQDEHIDAPPSVDENDPGEQ
jgi:hypothetical protein